VLTEENGTKSVQKSPLSPKGRGVFLRAGLALLVLPYYHFLGTVPPFGRYGLAIGFVGETAYYLPITKEFHGKRA
jgi:hypothetical protein